MYVQMTPVGAGAEVASHTTCTISPITPDWVAGLVMLGLRLSRMLAGPLVSMA